MGGLAPNFSILGHQAPPPPPGVRVRFFGIWVVQGFETCLHVSHIFPHFFFILCQSSEPFVAYHCQNWLLVELVVVLDSNLKVLGSNPSGGKFLLVSFALLFHRLRDCGWRAWTPPPPLGGVGLGGWVDWWVGGWLRPGRGPN